MAEIVDKEVGERLRLLQHIEGVNQEEMAAIIGCGHHSWSAYVTGTDRLPVKYAKVLKDRYGVTYDWIYENDGSDNKPSATRKIDAARKTIQPAKPGRPLKEVKPPLHK